MNGFNNGFAYVKWKCWNLESDAWYIIAGNIVRWCSQRKCIIGGNVTHSQLRTYVTYSWSNFLIRLPTSHITEAMDGSLNYLNSIKYWDILLILVNFCRFRVIIEMLKPDKPDSATTLKGLDYIDVPGLSKRDYRLNFFAHKEGTFSAKVRSMCLCTRFRSCSMPPPPLSILISLRHLHKPLPLTAFKA